VTAHQFGPIYGTEIITVVQCMYADYVIWGGGLAGLVDHFLTVRVGSQRQRAIFFVGEGGRIGQCNVGQTYKKNVALQCVCSVPMAE